MKKAVFAGKQGPQNLKMALDQLGQWVASIEVNYIPEEARKYAVNV